MILKEYEVNDSARDYLTEVRCTFLVTKNSVFEPKELLGKECEIVLSDKAAKAFAKEVEKRMIDNVFYEPTRISPEDTISVNKLRDLLGYKSIRTIKPEHGTLSTLQGVSDGIHPPFKGGYITNPCAEIPSFAEEYARQFNEGNKMDKITTPHTSRVDEQMGRTSQVNVSGNGLTGILTVGDEEATLRATLAGVPTERLEVRKIDNRLRVRVLPEDGEPEIDYMSQRANYKQLDLILAPEETVNDVTLALGILEITIDRGREIEDFEVHATD